jgi:hypothetical protein
LSFGQSNKRIGIFVKAIDRFLVNLKRQYRPLFDRIDTELIRHYLGEKARQCFAGVKPSQSKKVLSEVASDLYRLATQFEGHRHVSSMSSYKLLCRIVKEQCDVQPDGTIELKAPKQIPSDSLQNPSDPDASYDGHKGQGYQVQVMETYTEHEGDKSAADLNLITHVQVEKACQSDAQALLPAIEDTLEKDLAPEQLQADSLYGSDENCQEAEQMGVEVISPTMGSEKDSATTVSDFQFRTDGHVDSCPSGHEPAIRKKKKTRYSQGFAADTCNGCPRLDSCPVKKGKSHYFLRYDEKTMRLSKRRQQEKTTEFRDRYRWRAGVEATMSQYERQTGVKRLRVRGLKAVRFAAVMKAIAVNIARAVSADRARKRGQGSDPGDYSSQQGFLRLFKERFIRLGRLTKLFSLPSTKFWALDNKHT